MISIAPLDHLAASLRQSRGLGSKADIALAIEGLGLGGSPVALGDDCAAIPDGDGYLLLAIEGFMNEFVAGDPWFAGWCGVMVNLSDIAAMGGRPIAVVDALWSDGAEAAAPVLAGLREASARFGVPIVGGHTNVRCGQKQLSVAVLGRAARLLTSFDARPGDILLAAIDLRGRYREPFANFEAATEASGARLREDLEILPAIAEAGLCRAAKDISQGGIIGTAAMLAECSGVGISVDLRGVPAPEDADALRWLGTFPSFGYLLSVAPSNAGAVSARFTRRGIACSAIGSVTAERQVTLTDGKTAETVWDFETKALMGCGAGRLVG